MSRAEIWLLHLANLLVGGTGIVYAVVRYALEPPDPFSAIHPAQPGVQHAHIWTAPLLVFAIGAVWRTHAWSGVRLGVRARRRTGLALLAGAAPMVVSGYLLQTAVDPGWRRTWVIVHVATSSIWLAAYLLHQLLPRPAVGPPESAGDAPGR